MYTESETERDFTPRGRPGINAQVPHKQIKSRSVKPDLPADSGPLFVALNPTELALLEKPRNLARLMVSGNGHFHVTGSLPGSVDGACAS